MADEVQAPAEAATQMNHNIEVDLSENDSAYGDDLQSYTTSLASSVKAYPWLHGRRFHAYREGSYQFPNDEREQDRMDMVNEIMRLTLDDKLFFAPVQPKRVLDIGTGTGIWAMQMGEEFPEAEVIGNDFSPIQPQWVPPNVTFEVDDVESEWPERRPFDFIHSRYMTGSIQDWPALMGRCYEFSALQLQPGGYIECQDWDLLPYTTDKSALEDNQVVKLHEYLLEATDKIGRTIRPGPKLKEWIEGAGFVNVVHETRIIPLGMWPKDVRYKRVGAFNMAQFLEGIEAFTIAIFPQVLGWSVEKVQNFLMSVRKDATRKDVHLQFTFHVVYGQKPEA